MRRVLVAVAALALALGACTPAPDADVPDATSSLARRTPPPWDLAEVTPTTGPDGAKYLCNAGGMCIEDKPGQRPMVNPFPPDPAMTERMADRRLTREEYEAQFLDYKACMESFDIGVQVRSMSSPMISYSTGSVGNDFSSEAYRADAFCNDTFWHTANVHWQTVEMPQPFAAEDVEFLIGCLTDAGIAPVVTEVPDGGPEQALARDDLDMQVWETGSTGAMTRKQWDACDNMPSLVAEQENG